MPYHREKTKKKRDKKKRKRSTWQGYNDGEITRGVLLGARVAVREEEQRVRSRVREPNALFRGERERHVETRI